MDSEFLALVVALTLFLSQWVVQLRCKKTKLNLLSTAPLFTRGHYSRGIYIFELAQLKLPSQGFAPPPSQGLGNFCSSGSHYTMDNIMMHLRAK